MAKEEFRKKVCGECGLVITTKSDQDSLRLRNNKVEYYHVKCLKTLSARLVEESKKDGRGRPTSVTPEVLTKLIKGFKCNMNKTEACQYAGICTRTLERYMEKNSDFSQTIDALRTYPRMLAKLNILDKLVDGDVHSSEYTLDRTDSEYKPKSEVKNNVMIDPATALINAIKDRKKERGIE